jgi:hypothetical protein
MPVILYLLYGQNPIYRRQMIFSILTALRCLGPQRAQVKIAVLSDQPGIVDGLPVDHIELTANDIDFWSNHGSFYHRLKPLALGRILSQFGEPVALIDTDTSFISNPIKLFQRITPGAPLMHCAEYPIGTNHHLSPLMEKIGRGVTLGSVEITPQSMMWNSGVVGLHPQDAPLINQIVDLTDRLHLLAPHFTSEQLATSLVLQSVKPPAACSDIVDHYWTYRRSYCMLQIDRFLAKHSLNDLENTIQATAEVSLDFPRKPIRDQILAHVLGKIRGWSGSHQYAFLLYRTALHYGQRDPEVATLWARSTLSLCRDIVRPSLSDETGLRAHTRRIAGDLHHFSPNRIHHMTWLHPETRSAWMDFWKQGLDA